MSVAAPEPLIADEESIARLRPVSIEEPDVAARLPSLLPPPPRWGIAHYIIAVSLAVCFVSVALTLLRDRAREGELFRNAQAKRARAAVTAMTAAPTTSPPVVAATTAAAPREPTPMPAQVRELAAIAASSARESAKTERFEAQVALELGDIVRAEKVAQHAVENDPTDADGWLLLTAAQLELNQVEASRASLRSCAEKATRGPHWECVALLKDNGPN